MKSLFFAVPFTVGGFGAVRAFAQHKDLLYNSALEDTAFLLAVTTLKDSGLLNHYLGSSLGVAGIIGLVASGASYFLHLLSQRNKEDPQWLKNGLLAVAVIGVPASLAVGGYGIFKMCEGDVQVAISTMATITRARKM
jgi:hypothetical protein